jgi:hypothetical protein
MVNIVVLVLNLRRSFYILYLCVTNDVTCNKRFLIRFINFVSATNIAHISLFGILLGIIANKEFWKYGLLSLLSP